MIVSINTFGEGSEYSEIDTDSAYMAISETVLKN